MITRAWFKDFKLLEDVSLELGRLNVIVGRNGVGKSTVLEGLHLLLQLATPKHGEDEDKLGRPGKLFRGPRSPEHLARRVGEASENAGGFVLGIAPASAGTFELRADLGPPVSYDLQFGETHLRLPAPIDPKTPFEIKPRLFFQGPSDARLGEVVRLRLDAASLGADHALDGGIPRLEYTGAGLPSVIQHLMNLRDGTLDAIEADLRRIVPEARRVRVQPVTLWQREQVRVSIDGQDALHDRHRQVPGVRLEVEFAQSGWIAAEQLSEGTLLALGLLTALRHRAPRLLLLDDLDAALHPVAQRQMIKLIREILEARPHVQVVATSHSPYLLDEIQAHEAFVAGAADAISTRILRLDAHPAWEKRSGFMHPGEFWSAVGEGWVGVAS